jgi:hypothetical protein
LGISSAGSSGSIARVSGSMNVISASRTVLNNQIFGTPITSASFNRVMVDAYGKVIAGSVVLLQAGGIVLTNNSGSFFPMGSTAVLSGSYGNDFTVTYIPNDDAVCGIMTEDRTNNTQASLAVDGTMPVLVSGSVAVGHWLITSACTGKAEDSYYSVRPQHGAVGIALTSCSASGSVIADLRIRPFSGVSRLRQLPISGCAISPVADTTLTFNYKCDTSCDLLIVRCGGNLSKITSVTYNGTFMIPAFNSWGATNEGQAFYYLRYPSLGTYNVVITVPSSQTIKALTTSYTGHQVTSTGSPLRPYVTDGGGTTNLFTITPEARVGDIIIDMGVVVAEAGFYPVYDYHESELRNWQSGRQYVFGKKDYFSNQLTANVGWYDWIADNMYLIGMAICGT